MDQDERLHLRISGVSWKGARRLGGAACRSTTIVCATRHQNFEEASTVFGDTLSLTIFDEEHSDAEDRLIIIGMSLQHRLLVVVHTDRGDTIRIISARRATAHERKTYERNAEQYG